MTSLSDMHVLMVDDSPQMRFLIRCLLRASGIYQMSEAETAADALQIMRETTVDLVLLDWKMEPIDGLAFARMLRQSSDSPNPYVPILMLTAHTEISRVAAARDAGVTGFVKKPISARLLFERVSFALTDSRLYVRSNDFFGPDRRKGPSSNYAGPLRRASDHGIDETFDIEDARYSA
jgi:two-component system chemotaxis response regulator CheY